MLYFNKKHILVLLPFIPLFKIMKKLENFPLKNGCTLDKKTLFCGRSFNACISFWN